MGKLSKKLVMLITSAVVSSSFVLTTVASVAASAATTVSTTGSTQTQQVAATSNLQADSIQDGVILHAWCWSFNQIKAHLADIAAAGYTSIQTSPAQACAMGSTGTDTSLTNTLAHPSWYYHYQPTYYTLGNYQLGTAAEFKAMTDAAHSYGLKIIVDVVGNHLADIGSQYIDPDLLSHIHSAPKITNWQDRYQVTQGKVIGMPDVDTGSSVVQNKMISYLNTLADNGADGFRFDAAKSIELPTETAANAVSSTYWTNVINAIKSKNSNAFVYGEVLQGDEPGTNFPGYAKIMGVTGSTYGWFVRSAVGYEVWEDGSGKLGGNGTNGSVTPTINDGLISPYMEGQVKDGSIPNSRIVAYVETHDTYANAGASRSMSQNQIQLAWAMVAARAGSVPLYFNRPVSTSFASGTNYLSPQGEPYKTMGEAGSDDYKQPNVVAMNKFHNAMSAAKAGETVSRISNNNVMKIERGNAGIVLVNVGGSTSISTSTSLADGTYTNQAANGGTFTVSNGTLTGNLSGSSMAILYKTDTPVTPSATISQQGGSFTGSSLSLTLGLSNATSGTYTIGSNAAKTFTSSTTITIGSDLTAGQSVTVKLTATNGTTTTTNSYTFTKTVTPISSADVYCAKPSNWGSTLYVYAYNASGSVSKWPGTAMKDEGNGLFSYDLPDNWTGKVIFNDGGSNQYPGSGQPGLDYTAGTTMKYENGKWEAYATVFTLTSLTADKDTCNKGETVTFTAKATGGSAPYTYSYSVSDGTTTTALTATTDGTATWTPKAGGTYTVTAQVKDATGAAQSKTLSYTVTVNEALPSIDSITGVLSGSNIVYTVNASGGKVGTNLLFYKFYIVNSDGTETIGQNYSLSNQFTTPSTTKTIRVEVQNSNNDTVTSTYIYNAVVKSVTLTASPTDTQVQGTAVTLTGSVSNISGTVNYKFEVKNSSGTVTASKAYSTSNSYSWTASAAGTYSIVVYAKDSSGTEYTSAAKTYTITAPPVNVLTIKSFKTSLTSPQTVAEAIKLTASATGNGTVKYAFSVTKGGKTYLSKAYSTTSSTTWTPTEPGTYTLTLKVTDSTGKVIPKTITYTIL